MAASYLANFVYETTNAPGTASTINLAGTIAGRLSFAGAGFTSGAAVYYFLDDGTQAEWGSGSFTAGAPNQLTRTTVLGNTAGTTARLNFAGTTRVYCSLPAERAVFLDSSGNLTFPAAIATLLSLVLAQGASIGGNLAVSGTTTLNGAPAARYVSPPVTSADPGAPGDVSADAAYVYVCRATNTWVRSAIVGGW